MAQQAKKASVQQYLKIDEIKDGILILKDGSMKSAALVSSVNFALKSEQEKNAIITSYQSFLNSLSFPIQIISRSKRLDLTDYLNHLEGLEKKQGNMLLRDQIADYLDFIRRMLEVVNIMDKDFFVVVPFYPVAPIKAGILDKFTGSFRSARAPKLSSQKYEENRTQLLQRMDQVTAGLSSVGLKSIALNTEELIELFYSLYNPGLEQTQKITDTAELGAEVIEVQQGNSDGA